MEYLYFLLSLIHCHVGSLVPITYYNILGLMIVSLDVCDSKIYCHITHKITIRIYIQCMEIWWAIHDVSRSKLLVLMHHIQNINF